MTVNAGVSMITVRNWFIQVIAADTTNEMLLKKAVIVM